MLQAHIIASGVVQGVGFRWFVKMNADKIGILEAVKNLWDGTLEIFFQGTYEQIDEFLNSMNNARKSIQIDHCILDFIEIDIFLEILKYYSFHTVTLSLNFYHILSVL